MRIFLILILIHSLISAYPSQKIKLYAIYTPSHRCLVDSWFLPSLQATNGEEFEVILRNAEQECISAIFKETGWKRTTTKKVQMIINAIKENWGSIFIYSDVDVQFFAPIKQELLKLMEGKDLLIQKDNPRGNLCDGFFVCRANNEMLRLWRDVLMAMKSVDRYSDQAALNYCIFKQPEKYNIIWDYLPDTYFGGGTLTGKYWAPYNRLPVPRGIRIHHANWTKGIPNKVAQLKYVKNVVERFKLASK